MIICSDHSLAALLSKFRIDYSDVVIISDIHKKAMESTRKEFEMFIQPFRVKDEDNSDTSKSMLSS
jgi:solute carrier family 12 sodium/potassium/chloride transporter 2